MGALVVVLLTTGLGLSVSSAVDNSSVDGPTAEIVAPQNISAERVTQGSERVPDNEIDPFIDSLQIKFRLQAASPSDLERVRVLSPPGFEVDPVSTQEETAEGETNYVVNARERQDNRWEVDFTAPLVQSEAAKEIVVVYDRVPVNEQSNFTWELTACQLGVPREDCQDVKPASGGALTLQVKGDHEGDVVGWIQDPRPRAVSGKQLNPGTQSVLGNELNLTHDALHVSVSLSAPTPAALDRIDVTSPEGFLLDPISTQIETQQKANHYIGDYRKRSENAWNVDFRSPTPRWTESQSEAKIVLVYDRIPNDPSWDGNYTWALETSSSTRGDQRQEVVAEDGNLTLTADNTDPVADAGTYDSVPLNAPVRLSASASIDQIGCDQTQPDCHRAGINESSYEWSLADGTDLGTGQVLELSPGETPYPFNELGDYDLQLDILDRAGNPASGGATLTVRPDHVRILDAKGSPVSDVFLPADEGLKLFAHHADAEGNDLGQANVDWSASGDFTAGQLTSTSGPSTTLAFSDADATGQVTASHTRWPDTQADTTGLITIVPGTLSAIRVDALPSSTPADQPVTFTVIPEDVHGNERGDPISCGTPTSGDCAATENEVTFEPRDVGAIDIPLTATDPQNGSIQKTETINVTVAPLDHLTFTEIQDAVPADENPRVTVEPRDAKENLRADRVDFSLANQTGSATFTRIDANTVELDPVQTGEIEIQASATDPDNGTTLQETRTIDVTVGALDHLTYTEFEGSTTTDDNVTMTVEPRDEEDNLRSDRIGFEIEEGTGPNGTGSATLTRIDDTTVEVDPLQPGEIEIQASASDATNATTVWRNRTIEIQTGELADLEVESLGGEAITSRQNTTDEELDLVARGYDADGNLRGLVDANWSLVPAEDGQQANHDVGDLQPQTGTETTLAFTDVGKARVEAEVTAKPELSDRTGAIEVAVGELHHFAIVDTNGTLVADLSNTTDEELDLALQGFDADGNENPASFEANWSLEPLDDDEQAIGDLAPAEGQRTTLAFDTPGQARVVATNDSLPEPTNATGTLDVTVGALDHVSFTEFTDRASADALLSIRAEPRDEDGNARSDPISFSLHNDTGTASLSPINATATELDPAETGRVVLTANASDTANGTGPVSAERAITITPGALDRVVFVSDVSQTAADQPVELTVEPRDADDNARTDRVNFTLEGSGDLERVDEQTTRLDPHAAETVTVHAAASDDANRSQPAVANHTIEVTPGEPTELTIAPSPLTLTAGEQGTVEFDAQARDANGNDVPIDPSEDVDWTLDDDPGPFTDNRLSIPTTADSYSVGARLVDDADVNAETQLHVEPAELDSIHLEPSSLRLVEDATSRLSATPLDTFGNVVDTSVRFDSDAPDIASVNETTGKVHAQALGETNVTASGPDGDTTARLPVTVLARDIPLDRLELTPGEASLQAGDSIKLEATVIDEEGQTVTGLQSSVEVEDEDVLLQESARLFTGHRPGTSNVTVTVEDVSNTTVVHVEPGDPAQISVKPSTATVRPGESIDLDAQVRDVRQNPLPEAPLEWSLPDNAEATVDDNGTVHVGDTTANLSVQASSGDVSRQVILHVTDTQATRETATNVTTTVTHQTVDGVAETSHTAGLAEAESGSKVNLQAPAGESQTGTGDEAPAFDSAGLTTGRDATDVGVGVETREGSLNSTPEEVDVHDLRDEAKQRADGHRPALFITVRASENGTHLGSDALNELIDEMEVDFRVPVSYFEERPLEPDDVVLAEYSEGDRSGTVDARLVGDSPTDGFFRYQTTLTSFSSFAMIPQAEGQDTSPSTGGGGGSYCPSLSDSNPGVGDCFDAEAGDEASITEGLTGNLEAVELSFAEACDDCRLVTAEDVDADGLPTGYRLIDSLDVDLVDSEGDRGEVLEDVSLRFQLPSASTNVSDGAQLVVLHEEEGWQALATTFSPLDDAWQLTATSSGLSTFALAADEQAPELLGIYPEGTVYEATPNVTVTWTDNRGVDLDSVQFSLDGNEITTASSGLTLTDDALTYTFAPTIGGTTHEAHIALEDISGLETEHTWTFHLAESAVCNERPKLLSAHAQNRSGETGSQLRISIAHGDCPPTEVSYRVSSEESGRDAVLEGTRTLREDQTVFSIPLEGLEDSTEVIVDLVLKGEDGRSVEETLQVSSGGESLDEAEANPEMNPEPDAVGSTVRILFLGYTGFWIVALGAAAGLTLREGM